MSTLDTTGKGTEQPKIPELTLEEIQKAKDGEAKPAETKPEVKDVKVPTKYAGESDIQYNTRLQIYHATVAKNDSESEEEKSLLSKHLKDLRNGLSEKKVQPVEQPKPKESSADDSDPEVIKKNLKALGFSSKEEIEEAIANEIKKVEQKYSAKELSEREQEHRNATTEFYSTRPDIKDDADKRKQLENFVVNNIGINPNDSKQRIQMVLDMGAKYLFGENTTDREIEEADKKVNLTNITGKSGPSNSFKDSMKNKGFSDKLLNSFGEIKK